jgi:hypothetical protein
MLGEGFVLCSSCHRVPFEAVLARRSGSSGGNTWNESQRSACSSKRLRARFERGTMPHSAQSKVLKAISTTGERLPACRPRTLHAVIVADW